MALVSIVDDELRLCSNLDEYSFGKTNYDSIISQEAYYYNGKGFSIWNFEDVKSYETEGKAERIVFYCGKNPLSDKAKSLSDFFNEGNADLFIAVKAVCEALTMAAKNGNSIPVAGAGGILVDLSGANPLVLFLPEDLVKYSTNGLSREDSMKLCGSWINETLHGLPAICFERAAIVYKLISGAFPFSSMDKTERNSDILDRKFLPMELCINGINPELAREINKALKLNSNAVTLPGKKQKGKSSEDLTPTPEFPINLLDDAYKAAQEYKTTITDTDFREKAENYIKLQESRIAAKRKLRKNYVKIIAGAVVALALSVFIIDTIKTRRDEYCSIGLTSVETIQGFLYGTNTKQNTLMSNLVKGKEPQKAIDTISQIYVLDKQRRTYDRDNGFASPENWLLYSTNEDKYKRSGIYGVTNVKIDGKPVELNIKLYKYNENPAPLTREGNITLEDGAESVHKVEYYLIHSEGENNNFVLEHITDIFSLKYIKNRWLITDISTDNQVIPVKCSVFKEDYFNKLAETNGDVLNAVKSLRKKYSWLPTDKAMSTELARIEYALQHPFEDIGF